MGALTWHIERRWLPYKVAPIDRRLVFFELGCIPPPGLDPPFDPGYGTLEVRYNDKLLYRYDIPGAMDRYWRYCRSQPLDCSSVEDHAAERDTDEALAAAWKRSTEGIMLPRPLRVNAGLRMSITRTGRHPSVATRDGRFSTQIQIGFVEMECK